MTTLPMPVRENEESAPGPAAKGQVSMVTHLVRAALPRAAEGQVR